MNREVFIFEEDKIQIWNKNNKEIVCSKILLSKESQYFSQILSEETDCTEYTIPLGLKVNSIGIELAIRYLHYGCVYYYFFINII